MKFVTCLLVLQCLVLLLSHDVNSLSIGNEDVEANVIDNRNTATKNDPKQACGKNEYFSDCGSTCEKNCDDMNNDDHSSVERCVGAAVCMKKCICKDGYVRDNGNNGKCIRLQECPRVKH